MHDSEVYIIYVIVSFCVLTSVPTVWNLLHLNRCNCVSLIHRQCWVTENRSSLCYLVLHSVVGKENKQGKRCSSWTKHGHQWSLRVLAVDRSENGLWRAVRVAHNETETVRFSAVHRKTKEPSKGKQQFLPLSSAEYEWSYQDNQLEEINQMDIKSCVLRHTLDELGRPIFRNL
jgi:hypothetical protein